MRRPRRPARQLPAVGGAARRARRVQPSRSATATELQVFFAGGIHDARSAAMVRPRWPRRWPGRGAAVGVLMGTAYLFTAEAVDARRDPPLFQQQAHRRRAHRSAGDRARPRHPVPAQSASPTTFARAAGQTAGARGGPSRGGLGAARAAQPRPAADRQQGHRRRDGDDLRRRSTRRASCTRACTWPGQVAVLRSATTTIGRAARRGDRERRRRRSLERRSRVELRRPEPAPSERARPARHRHRRHGLHAPAGAPTSTTFWANVLGGVDAVTEVPADRWDAGATTIAPEIGHGRTTPSRSGAASSPRCRSTRCATASRRRRSAASTRCSCSPSRSRGARSRTPATTSGPFDRERTVGDLRRRGGQRPRRRAVRLARASCRASSGELPAELAERLPAADRGLLRRHPRQRHRRADRQPARPRRRQLHRRRRLRLLARRGRPRRAPSCAAGRSDMVLCRRRRHCTTASFDYLLLRIGRSALSPTRALPTFDATARRHRHSARASPCVVLKRLADAERDGDRIYAVIKGVGGSSDGKRSGLTAPRPEGQLRALRRAYAQAGLSPASVGLVEAHGTGTVVGDRTELDDADRASSPRPAPAPAGCAIGSVKSHDRPHQVHRRAGRADQGRARPAPPACCRRRRRSTHAEPGLGRARPARSSSTPSRGPGRAGGRRASPASAPSASAAPTSTSCSRRTPTRRRPARPATQWPRRAVPASAGAARRRAAAPRRGRRSSTLAPRRLRGPRPGACAPGPTTRRAGPVPRVAFVADRPGRRSAALAAPQRLAGEHAPDAAVPSPRQPPPPHRRGRLPVPRPGQPAARACSADLFVAFPRLQRYLRGRGARCRAPRCSRRPPSTPQATAGAAGARSPTPESPSPPSASPTWRCAALLRRPRRRARDDLAGHSYGELVALAAAGALDPADAARAVRRPRAEAILGRGRRRPRHDGRRLRGGAGGQARAAG